MALIRRVTTFAIFIAVIAMFAVGGSRALGGALPRGAELLYKSYNSTLTRAYFADIERRLIIELRASISGTSHVWSADGEQIAFVSSADGDTDVYVMDAVGHHVRNLTNNDAADYSPAWSPDGRWIAYMSGMESRENRTAVYIIATNGETPRNISGMEGSASFPRWSSDSEQIAFTLSNRGFRTTYLTRIDAPTTAQIFPFLPLDMMVYQWVWSPDGTRVAFIAIDDATQLGENQRIFTAPLADDADTLPLLSPLYDHAVSYDTPVWSPDGTQIAYAAVERVTSDIFIASVDSDDPPRRLTTMPANEHFPAWSSDGRWIAFTSGDNQYSEIYVVEVETGRLIRVTRDRVGDFTPLWRPGSR